MQITDRDGMLDVFYKDFNKGRVAGFTKVLAAGKQVAANSLGLAASFPAAECTFLALFSTIRYILLTIPPPPLAQVPAAATPSAAQCLQTPERSWVPWHARWPPAFALDAQKETRKLRPLGLLLLLLLQELTVGLDLRAEGTWLTWPLCAWVSAIVARDFTQPWVVVISNVVDLA